MKNQFILFQRVGVFYCEDTTTGKQSSLRTRDKADALRLLNAKNEATRQPAMNLQISQVHLQHGYPALAARTWQHVMEQMTPTKAGNTLLRWQSAIQAAQISRLRAGLQIWIAPEDLVAFAKGFSHGSNDELFEKTHAKLLFAHLKDEIKGPGASYIDSALKIEKSQASTFVSPSPLPPVMQRDLNQIISCMADKNIRSLVHSVAMLCSKKSCEPETLL